MSLAELLKKTTALDLFLSGFRAQEKTQPFASLAPWRFKNTKESRADLTPLLSFFRMASSPSV